MELIMLCGAPASGKSSWAKETMNNLSHLGLSVCYISRDKIRESMVGSHVKTSNEYFSKEKQVYKEFVNQINEAIKHNYHHVIVDATHVNPGSRKKLLKRLNTNGLSFRCVVFDPGRDVCLERNTKRTGFAKVPDKAIEDMYKSFKYPSLEEFENYGFISAVVNEIK